MKKIVLKVTVEVPDVLESWLLENIGIGYDVERI